MPETERLCVREAVTGVEETEEEEALLEPEPMPDVSREEREVDSQNWRAGRRGDAEDTVGLASPSATDGVYQRWGREARGISLTCDNGGPTQLQPLEAQEPCRAARATKGRGLPSSPWGPACSSQPQRQGRGGTVPPRWPHRPWDPWALPGATYLLLLAVGGLGDEADVDLLHVGAAGAGGGDAHRVGGVPTAQVLPTLELVKGFRVRAAAGTGLGARWLPAARREVGQVRREQGEGAFGWQDSSHVILVPCSAQPEMPHAGPHLPPGTHSLHLLMMPVFFLAFNVLLADSDSGSISHDSP